MRWCLGEREAEEEKESEREVRVVGTLVLKSIPEQQTPTLCECTRVIVCIVCFVRMRVQHLCVRSCAWLWVCDSGELGGNTESRQKRSHAPVALQRARGYLAPNRDGTNVCSFAKRQESLFKNCESTRTRRLRRAETTCRLRRAESCLVFGIAGRCLSH